MPVPLKPAHLSTASKRAHSADNSSSGTPVSEKNPVLDDIALPAFLRQSSAEITAKFEKLTLQHLQRVTQARKHGEASQSPWNMDESLGARQRNRYYDIKPFSKTRIRLKVPAGGFDYINASPILLKCSETGEERKYIATQGPKESVVSHFWQMVWDETGETAVVVMLTQLMENTREKCYQYYPDNLESDAMDMTFTSDVEESIPATLKLDEVHYDEDCKSTIRKLSLSCNGKTKAIHHLLFCGWPDHGVPKSVDRSALLELIRLSRSKNEGWGNPRVVHCSAGVGRSGTFIALEHLFAELDTGQFDDMPLSDSAADPVHDTVVALRDQRMLMVQSQEQYQFLYDSCADAFRARARERALVAQVEAKTTPGGEPAHKAMRLTRHLKTVLSSFRERSSSRKGEDRKRKNDKEESKAAATAQATEDPNEEDEASTIMKDVQLAEETASQASSVQDSNTQEASSQDISSQELEANSNADTGLTQDAGHIRIEDDSEEGKTP